MNRGLPHDVSVHATSPVGSWSPWWSDPLPPVWLACLLSWQKMVATIHDVSRGGDGQWMSVRFRPLIGLAETVLYRIPYAKIIAVSQSAADALVK